MWRIHTLSVCFGCCREQLLQVLSTLPEREQEVLSMRFGLEAGYSLTPEAVGRRLKVTGQRIRQIEAKALQAAAVPVAQHAAKGLS